MPSPHFSGHFHPNHQKIGRPEIIRRGLLRPGGFLILPTFVPSEPPASAEVLHSSAGQAYALSRLRFGYWGVPVHTADELRAEAEAAGFIYVRRAPFSTSYLLLFQRPV